MDSNTNMSGELVFHEKKSKKPLFILIVVLIIVLGAGTAYGYTSLNWFKSAKQIYLGVEKEAFSDLGDSLDKGVNKVYSQAIKPASDESVLSHQDFSVKLSGNIPKDPRLTPIIDLLNKATLSLDYFQNSKESQTYIKANVALSGNSLIGAELFSDKDKSALGVPALYKKYAVVNAKDQPKFKKQYGLDLPKRTPTNAEIFDAIKVPKAEYEAILNVYAKIYTDNLKDSQVSIGKGSFKEEGLEKDVQLITVTLNKEENQQLSNKLADQLEKDDQLVELIYTRYGNINKLYTDAGIASALGTLSKSDIQAGLKDFATSLREVDEKSEGTKMMLYIGDGNKILKRQIVDMSNANNDFTFANWSGKDAKKYYLLDLNAVNDAGKAEKVKLLFTSKKDGNTQNATFDFTTKFNDSGKDYSPVTLKGESSVTKEDNKVKSNVKFTLDIDDSGNKSKLSGDVQTNYSTDDKNKSTESDTKAKLTLNTAGINGIILDLTLKSKVQNGASFAMPKLDASNSSDIVNMSQQEMMNMQNEITKNLQDFMSKNATLFKSFGNGIM